MISHYKNERLIPKEGERKNKKIEACSWPPREIGYGAYGLADHGWMTALVEDD